MKNTLTIFYKEWLIEFRTKQGLIITLMFNFLAVSAMSFASYGSIANATVAAGIFSVILLFSAVITIPRTFLAEDEQNTIDLLRLMSQPEHIYLGKTLYCFIQLAFTGLLLSILYIVFLGIQVMHWPIFLSTIILECLTLCLVTGLCSLFVLGTNNRWLLSIAIALPLLLPQIAMSVGALRVGLGVGSIEGGLKSIMGLMGFSLALLSISPMLAKEVLSTK